jgi:hypothetical protein
MYLVWIFYVYPHNGFDELAGRGMERIVMRRVLAAGEVFVSS